MKMKVDWKVKAMEKEEKVYNHIKYFLENEDCTVHMRQAAISLTASGGGRHSG